MGSYNVETDREGPLFVIFVTFELKDNRRAERMHIKRENFANFMALPCFRLDVPQFGPRSASFSFTNNPGRHRLIFSCRLSLILVYISISHLFNYQIGAFEHIHPP